MIKTKRYINNIPFTTWMGVDHITQILYVSRSTYLMLKTYDDSVVDGSAVRFKVEAEIEGEVYQTTAWYNMCVSSEEEFIEMYNK